MKISIFLVSLWGCGGYLGVFWGLLFAPFRFGSHYVDFIIFFWVEGFVVRLSPDEV